MGVVETRVVGFQIGLGLLHDRVLGTHRLEQVLDLLAHAGFDHDTSVRALQFVLGVVWGNTHDQLLAEAQPDGAHPQQTQMLSQEADLGSYPRMQRAVERNSIYGAFDARFGFELDGVIRALRSALQNGEDR